MTEQQPVEATPATPTPGSQTEAPTERTAAEVEAEYKARLSGKDRSHDAEVKELRRQLDAANATSTTTATEASTKDATVEDLQRRLAESEQTNKRQASDFAAQTRASKFPLAAEALDPSALAAMDEAKLAGLEARLKQPAPTIPVDPNTPQGGVPAPKPTDQKSSKELKADLARGSAAFAEELRNR